MGWTPDGWTPGPRRQTGWMDTHWWTQTGDGQQAGTWHPDHCDEDPTAGSGPAAPPGGRRLGDEQPGATRQKDTAKAWLPPRPVSCRVTLRCPAGALAHCSRVLELEGTRRGQW